MLLETFHFQIEIWSKQKKWWNICSDESQKKISRYSLHTLLFHIYFGSIAQLAYFLNKKFACSYFVRLLFRGISIINCLTTKLTDNDTRDVIFYQYQSEKAIYIFQNEEEEAHAHIFVVSVCVP